MTAEKLDISMQNLIGLPFLTDTTSVPLSLDSHFNQNFELAGLLNRNPYTMSFGYTNPPNYNPFDFNNINTLFSQGFAFDTSQFKPQYSTAIDFLYTNFVNELNTNNAKWSEMMANILQNFSGTVNDEDTSYFNYDIESLKNKWSKKKPNLSDAFYNRVIDIAKKINCDPNDLMGVMNAESGINAAAKNPSSSASGLIQFMESTARDLGTTTADLRKMSAEEQLNYVEKYLQRAKSIAGISQNQKIGAGTLYALVFMPAKAKGEIIANSGAAYACNKGLDINKDGQITKNELAQKVKSFSA